MDITFQTSKLEKIFSSADKLRKAYGNPMDERIRIRIAVLRAACNLALVSVTPPERRHQLKGERKGQFAVNITGKHRLIFKPNHKPLPRKEDGGVDVEQVTAITIIKVEDYH